MNESNNEDLLGYQRLKSMQQRLKQMGLKTEKLIRPPGLPPIEEVPKIIKKKIEGGIYGNKRS